VPVSNSVAATTTVSSWSPVFTSPAVAAATAALSSSSSSVLDSTVVAATTAASSSSLSAILVSSDVTATTAANEVRTSHREGDADAVAPVTHAELLKKMQALQQEVAPLQKLVRKRIAQQ